MKKPLIFLIAVAAVGVIVIAASRAAQSFLSLEPDKAQLNGDITRISDSSASGGSSVQFNPADPPATKEPDLLHIDTSGLALKSYGQMSQSDFEGYSPSGAFWSNATNYLSVVQDSQVGRALEMKYIPKSDGSTRSQVRWKLKSTNRVVYSSYKLKFMPGWEYVLGGKLPGLAGGTAPVGGSTDTNGMSARLMWRGNGKGDAAQEEIITYLYWLEKAGKWGTGFSTNYRIPVDKWVTIRQRVDIGTAGNRDASIQLWIDGTRYINETNMKFLSSGANWKIDSLLFSTFYGGSTSEWSPSKTTYARFADFKVGTSADHVD